MPIPFPEDSVEGNHSYNEEENPDPHSNTRGGWGSKSKHEEEIQELRGQRLSSTGLLETKCRRRERRRPGRTGPQLRRISPGVHQVMRLPEEPAMPGGPPAPPWGSTRLGLADGESGGRGRSSVKERKTLEGDETLIFKRP